MKLKKTGKLDLKHPDKDKRQDAERDLQEIYITAKVFSEFCFVSCLPQSKDFLCPFQILPYLIFFTLLYLFIRILSVNNPQYQG